MDVLEHNATVQILLEHVQQVLTRGCMIATITETAWWVNASLFLLLYLYIQVRVHAGRKYQAQAEQQAAVW